MKNYVQDGNTLELTAPVGGVVSGTAYKIDSLVVIATVTAAAGESFVGQVTGVVEGPKESGAGDAWTQLVKIYWDDIAKKFTKTSTANTLVGVATKAAGDNDTTGHVRLDGVAR